MIGFTSREPCQRRIKMTKDMFLADQALGALMMALQKSLLEQSDLVPVLKDFRFRLGEDGLMVMNPPVIKFGEEEEDAEV